MKKVVSLLLTVLMTLCVLSVNVLAFDNKPAELTVKVKYVVHANPVLTLPSEKTIFKGEKFNPLDVVVSAKDDEGTDLKSNVGVSGQYDVNTVGSYTLKYSVTDSFGGSDEKTFKLNVIEKLKEENTSEQVTVKEDAPVKEVEADIKTDSIVDSVVREEGNKTSTLTPEQKQAIKDGASVKLELTVDSTADDSTNEDSKLIDKAIKEVNSSTAIGALLDINLLCTVTRNNESLGTSKITVTSEPVKVTVTVPDTLVNTDSTVTRDYDVARLHDGKVDLLGAKYDAASKKLTFDTSLFSTYAIVYTDTKVEQPKKNASSSSSSGYKKPVVNTGWGFNPANIEFFGDSGSTKLEVDGLPECNVLNVSYTETLDLKSADGKTVKANVAFVKEIKTNNDYTLTVSLQNPSDKPAPGTYEGTITVSFVAKEYEAKIGDEYYDTLKEAVDAAKDGDTIVLLDNITVSNTPIELEKGKSCISIDNKNITIDGNHKDITLSADYANDNTFGIYITGSDSLKTVTIKNATINTTDLERAIRTEGSIGFNIEKSTITTNGVGIHVKGANTVEICDTTITVNAIDAYSAHKRAGVVVGGPDANVTVDGCIINAINERKTENTLTWCKGLYVGNSAKNGVLTVNNTKVEADFSIAIDGTDDSGKPSTITINSGEYSGIIGSPSGGSYKSLIINGGTFTGIENYNSFYGKDDPVAKLVISGGTFNVDPAAYVNSKYHSVNNGDGTYSIERTVLAYIDNFKFSEIDGDTTKELFSDSFDSDSNYEKYCPHHTGTNPNSTSHDGYVDTFAIEDGVAKIYSNSAWTNFYKGDMNSATADNIDVNKSYKLQYDVKINPNYSKDITDVKKTLTFNNGSWGGSWASDCLSFAKDSSGNLGIYDSTPSNIGNKIADIEADKFYTIETSFVPTLDNGQATKITVTTSIITDTETKQINQFEFSDLGDTFNGYCWDIYYPAN